MISFRQADLLPSLQKSTIPPVLTKLILDFPVDNSGRHARKDGRYYAKYRIWINLMATDPRNELVIKRIEPAVHSIVAESDYDEDGYILAYPDESIEEFYVRIRNAFLEKLEPISDTPPVSSGWPRAWNGKYSCEIELNIRPI